MNRMNNRNSISRMKTMATKSKKVKRYFPMTEMFMEEYPACCGIEVVTGICADECDQKGDPPSQPVRMAYHDDYWYRDIIRNWENDCKNWGGITKEELFKDFLKKVSEKRNDRHVQLTFVKRRKGKKTGDMPEGFQQFLEENGWYTIDEFVNPNHGNYLCVMGKTFRNKKKSVDLYW